MGSTRPTRPMWIGLDLCDRLDWVEFFLTHHGELGKKIPSIQSNPTHAHPYLKPLPARFVKLTETVQYRVPQAKQVHESLKSQYLKVD